MKRTGETVRPDAGGWISGPSADLMTRVNPLTTTELGQLLGIHSRTIYRWLALGWIRGFRTSSKGHWRFPPSEVTLIMQRMGFQADDR